MDKVIQSYLSRIGRKGGKKSRRILNSKEAKNMVIVREAQKAFRKFFSECFWSFNPDYRITLADVPWVAQTLRKNGGRKAWEIGAKLCR